MASGDGNSMSFGMPATIARTDAKASGSSSGCCSLQKGEMQMKLLDPQTRPRFCGSTLQPRGREREGVYEPQAAKQCCEKASKVLMA